MAQKALKTLASRNTTNLNRTHLISLGLNVLFLLIHFVFSSRSLYAWFFFALPSFIIEFWFERIARPTYTGSGPDRELKRAGEDLEAKGLTEWMWDVLYWTWACIILAALLGNKAWWAWIAIPLYSAYLAFTTFTGAKQGLAGMGGAGQDTGPAGQSKRQAKMEKRGGQKMQYR